MERNSGPAEIQHYVPQLLLRGFLREPESKKQVFVFDKHEGRSFRTNIANIAAERSFYDIDTDADHGNVEGRFAELESSTKSALERLIQVESLAALTDEQKSWLSVFLAAQQLRTRHFREVIKTLNEGTAEHIRNLGFDPRETEGFELFETENDIKRGSLAYLADALGPHSTLMAKKACFLTFASKDQPFWISDHPVVMHNDRKFEPYGNLGLAVPGIQIYLPLTSTLLLALWCTTNADNLRENVERANRERQRLSAMRVHVRDVEVKEVEREIEKWQAIVNDGEPLTAALANGSAVQATTENITFYNHLQVTWSHRYLISPIDDFALAKKMISDNSMYKRGLNIKF